MSFLLVLIMAYTYLGIPYIHTYIFSMISAGDQAEKARRDHYSNLFCHKKVIKIPTNKIRFHKNKQKKGGHNSDLSVENEYYRNKFASMKATGVNANATATDPASHNNNTDSDNSDSDSDSHDNSNSDSSSSSDSGSNDDDDDEENSDKDSESGESIQEGHKSGYASKSAGFTPAPPNSAYKTSIPFNHTQRNIK